MCVFREPGIRVDREYVEFASSLIQSTIFLTITDDRWRARANIWLGIGPGAVSLLYPPLLFIFRTLKAEVLENPINKTPLANGEQRRAKQYDLAQKRYTTLDCARLSASRCAGASMQHALDDERDNRENGWTHARARQ